MRLATVLLGCLLVVAVIGVGSVHPVMAKSDPLKKLAQKWDCTGFKVGGDDPLSSCKCGKAKVSAPQNGAVSFTAVCESFGDYYFRLERIEDKEDYLITLKSKVGFSVDEFSVEHVDGVGWIGDGSQILDGETIPITVMVVKIEGRNWHGWTIMAVPDEAIEQSPNEVEHPYWKLDLTRRKLFTK